jgi:hypothetical protein
MKKLALLIAALSLPCPGLAAPPTNAAKQGVENGFKACVEPFDAAVRFVHKNDETYAYVSTWSKRAPDTEVFNTITSERYPDAHGVASFTGVKAASGKCNVVFTQVLAVPDKSCDALRKESFADWKFYVALNGINIYEDPTSSDVSVMLLPTGKASCVVLKQAVLYAP